MYIYLYKQL